MNLSSFNYKTYIPVRFGDLNAFGVVNNDVFLSYFEIAHSGYWKHITKWQSKSKGVIIGRAELNYRKPVRFNDELYAYVKTSKVGNCSFEVEYILTVKKNADEEICTTGSTTCIFYDFEKDKPIPLPAIQREKMMAFEALAV